MGLLTKEVKIKLNEHDLCYFEASELGIYLSMIATDETFVETINWLRPSGLKTLLSASEDYAESKLTNVGKENLILIRDWINIVLSK